jgi:polyhydroxyalkanoate synthase
LQDLAAGIKAYRGHPYHRGVAEPATLWRDGTTRLLDYRPDGGQPVLFVPSLINRAYILDLSAECSLLRWLAAETDLRPLLVDWDAPGEVEREFTLTDYIAGRLDAAFDAALAESPAGAPIAVAGYCMGGLLALALAIRRQDQVSRLALLATPWDFHSERVAQAEAVGRAIAAAAPLLETYGELPVDVIQSMFTGLDPFLVLRKFISFAHLDPASEKAAQFVALEDWLNDGVPLAAPVARECLAGWYGENTPHRLNWRVDREIVDPAAFTKPALVLAPAHDRIVPPGSAKALGAALPGATVKTLPFGHIGMVAGARAKSAVWSPLADWLSAE